MCKSLGIFVDTHFLLKKNYGAVKAKKKLLLERRVGKIYFSYLVSLSHLLLIVTGGARAHRLRPERW